MQDGTVITIRDYIRHSTAMYLIIEFLSTRSVDKNQPITRARITSRACAVVLVVED